MPIIDILREKLSRAFVPAELDVVDDSHRHHGHAGSRPGGETHFTVEITAEAFAGKSRVERQRMVYAVLADELAGGLHALALTVRSPQEPR